MEENSNAKHSSFWGIMVIAGTVIGGGCLLSPLICPARGFFGGRLF
ncbi:Low affinity tryptophan permease [Citrobacter amalonaticus]|nr:Low affinity tryptophan permease [Citrobacter amalonaticus]